MRKLIVLFLFGLMAGATLAQTTTVSATITDHPDSQTWNNGTWSARYLSGSNTGSTVFSGGLNSSGAFSQALPSNTVWQITLCPNASVLACPAVNLTVGAGPTQNADAVLSASAASPRFYPFYGSFGYNDTEVSGSLVPGNQYCNVTSGLTRVWNGSWQNALSCTGGGGGGAVNSVFGRTGTVTAQSGDYSFSQIIGALNLASQATGLLSIANGGTGTASPGLVSGTNVTITGSWPNQTINSSGGGGISYPSGTGIAVVTGGAAWGTTLTAPSGAIVGTTDTQTLTNKTVDGVTPTTFGFVDPTSSIQTQLNAKAPIASPVFTTMVTVPTVTSIGATNGNFAYNSAALAFEGVISGTGIAFPWISTSGGTSGDCVKFLAAFEIGDAGSPCGSGGGAVSSVANSDGTLTISPTTGSVVASLALGHANTWSALQTHSAGINFSGTTSPLEFSGAAGTAGQCVISGGTGTTPSWGACGSGGSGISGLTAGFIPIAGSATTLTANSHLDDGITTAATITSSEAMAVGASGTPSQMSMTYNAVTPTAGSSTTAVYAVSSSGLAEVSEAGAAFSEVCTPANAACGIGGNTTSTSLTTNTLPKANGANSIINSTITDNGTTVSTTEPFTALTITATGTTAGYLDLPQGTTNSAGTTSIRFQAPTSVTSQLRTLAGTPATGLTHWANSSGTMTETVTGVAIADLTATGTPSSTTFLRGDNTWSTPAGGGTVTSVATTGPITGGTITSSGTIACATCVTSAASLTSGALMTGSGSQASQTVTTGTGVVTALGTNTGTAGAFGVLIASGTAVLNTAAVGSGACETVVTVSASGVATTDTINVGFNGDPTAVTGYGASATGAVLTIYPYPTANNVNVKVCNNTALSITPGALTLNFRVVR